MTDQELEAIERRAAGATPGPWRCWTNGLDAGIVAGYDPYRPERPYEHFIFGGEPHEGYIEPEDADAVFTAHARGDVPALLAEVRNLQRLLAATNETLGDVCRELAIYEIAADPAAVARVRKECTLPASEKPSPELGGGRLG